MVEERPLYRHERHLRSFQFFCSVLIVLWSIQLAIFSFDSPFVFYNYTNNDDCVSPFASTAFEESLPPPRLRLPSSAAHSLTCVRLTLEDFGTKSDRKSVV